MLHGWVLNGTLPFCTRVRATARASAGAMDSLARGYFFRLARVSRSGTPRSNTPLRGASLSLSLFRKISTNLPPAVARYVNILKRTASVCTLPRCRYKLDCATSEDPKLGAASISRFGMTETVAIAMDRRETRTHTHTHRSRLLEWSRDHSGSVASDLWEVAWGLPHRTGGRPGGFRPWRRPLCSLPGWPRRCFPCGCLNPPPLRGCRYVVPYLRTRFRPIPHLEQSGQRLRLKPYDSRCASNVLSESLVDAFSQTLASRVSLATRPREFKTKDASLGKLRMAEKWTPFRNERRQSGS